MENLVEEIENHEFVYLEGTLIHKNGMAVDLSQSFAQMFGYQKEELLGRNLIKILILPKYHGIIAESIKRDYKSRYEAEGIKKDGSIFPITIKGKTMSIGRNNIVRVAIFRNQPE